MSPLCAHQRSGEAGCTNLARHTVPGLEAGTPLCCAHFDAHIRSVAPLMVHLPGTATPMQTDQHGDLLLYFEKQCGRKSRNGYFPPRCETVARLRRWFRNITAFLLVPSK